MKIQIDNVTYFNLGAELMLNAVISNLKKRIPDAEFYAGKALKRSPVEKLQRSGVADYSISSRIKRKILDMTKSSSFDLWNYGLLLNDQIDVVIDAGGFRFGDQWKHNKYSNRKLVSYYKALKKENTKIFFLPQAFGPFDNHHSVEAIRIIHQYADLIFAREETSFEHLRLLFPKSDKIRSAPDFTVENTSMSPNNTPNNEFSNKICIVPNSRMITHVEKARTDYYFKFIKEVITLSRNNGHECFLLSFCDNEDLNACNLIVENSEGDLNLIKGVSAIEAKEIIKSSYAVFSSRYHASVSALNQNVPCVSSSWSHKYERLFDFYKMSDFIITGNVESDRKQFRKIIDPQTNSRIRTNLATHSANNLQLSEEMWAEIIRRIKN